MDTFSHDHTSRTFGARLVAAATLVLLLGACSSTSTDSTTNPPAATGAAASPSVAPVGTSVGVVENEFSITLDKATFTPGDYTFAIQNQGSFPHNLIIEGPGVDSKKSPTLGAGESGSLTVGLQKGSYELTCSVPGHKDKGMDIKITVG
ncbi:MAG TPA: plastocyanin/azurin family copper-binding protein [Dermatophilaceae bacterium]|nr:plastocyanin/azurin family copper-binding protein [Dermatophilaceae bacterium]